MTDDLEELSKSKRKIIAEVNDQNIRPKSEFGRRMLMATFPYPEWEKPMTKHDGAMQIILFRSRHRIQEFSAHSALVTFNTQTTEWSVIAEGPFSEIIGRFQEYEIDKIPADLKTHPEFGRF